MSSLGIAGDAGQNLIRGFRPGKRFGGFIVDIQIFADSRLQFFDAAKDSTPYTFVGDFREPSFHQVDPRAISGREVEVETRSFGEPLPGERGFVSPVVIQHDMNIKIGGYIGFNRVQKSPELQRAMAAMPLANNPAAFQIQRRE